MGTGTLAKLMFATGIVGVMAACEERSSMASQLSRGSMVPAQWMAPGADTAGNASILWVFRTEDCLTCQNMDYPVRKVQSSFGPSVPLFAVHVGSEEQAAIPQSFFRTRRLRVEQSVNVPLRDFRNEFGDVALPALYVVKGRRILWSSVSDSAGPSGAVQLDTLVRRLQSRTR